MIRRNPKRIIISLGAIAALSASAALAESIFDFDLRMQRIDKTSQSAMKNLSNKDLEAAIKDAQKLETMYGELEEYFAQREHGEEAVKLSKTGRSFAAEASRLAASNDSDGAFNAIKAVTRDCHACHLAYDPL